MEDQVHRKITELLHPRRLEIANLKHSADLAAANFRQEMESIRSNIQEIIIDQGKVANLKNSLREAEDFLEKALSMKNSNEVKHKNASKSVTTAKAQTIELKKSLTAQKVRKDEYTSVISQQLLALKTLEDQCNQKNDERENLRETILWYDKVLGFKVTGGTGVKFTFTKIDIRNPEKEFSFTVKLHGDTYSLVQCDLEWDNVSDLFEELNHTNDLFKFVRIMRLKFVASIPSDADALGQGLSTTTLSPPPLSTDTRSELLNGENNSPVSQLNGQCSPVSLSGDLVARMSTESRPYRRTQHHHVSKSPKSVSAPRRSQRVQGSTSKH